MCITCFVFLQSQKWTITQKSYLSFLYRAIVKLTLPTVYMFSFAEKTNSLYLIDTVLWHLSWHSFRIVCIYITISFDKNLILFLIYCRGSLCVKDGCLLHSFTAVARRHSELYCKTSDHKTQGMLSQCFSTPSI